MKITPIFVLILMVSACAETLYQQPSAEIDLHSIDSDSKLEKDMKALSQKLSETKKPDPAEKEVENGEWPRLKVSVLSPQGPYGAKLSRPNIDELGKDKPRSYRFMSAIFTNLEDENLEVSFLETPTVVRLHGAYAIPKDSTSCELSVLSELYVGLDEDCQRSQGFVKVYSAKKNGRGEELKARAGKFLNWYLLEPKQSVWVDWLYSHALVPSAPILLPRGVLPKPEKCYSKIYQQFYERCNGKIENSFYDQCVNRHDLMAVDYASFNPPLVSYEVQRPNNTDVDKAESFDIELNGPSMTIP